MNFHLDYYYYHLNIQPTLWPAAKNGRTNRRGSTINGAPCSLGVGLGATSDITAGSKMRGSDE